MKTSPDAAPKAPWRCSEAVDWSGAQSAILGLNAFSAASLIVGIGARTAFVAAFSMGALAGACACSLGGIEPLGAAKAALGLAAASAALGAAWARSSSRACAQWIDQQSQARVDKAAQAWLSRVEQTEGLDSLTASNKLRELSILAQDMALKRQMEQAAGKLVGREAGRLPSVFEGEASFEHRVAIAANNLAVNQEFERRGIPLWVPAPALAPLTPLQAWLAGRAVQAFLRKNASERPISVDAWLTQEDHDALMEKLPGMRALVLRQTLGQECSQTPESKRPRPRL